MSLKSFNDPNSEFVRNEIGIMKDFLVKEDYIKSFTKAVMKGEFSSEREVEFEREKIVHKSLHEA